MCFSVLHQLVQLSQQVQLQRHQRERPLIEAASDKAAKAEMV